MAELKLRCDGRVILPRTAVEATTRRLWDFVEFSKLERHIRNVGLSYHMPRPPIATERWDASKGVDYLKILWLDVTELFFAKRDMSVVGILRGPRASMVRDFWSAAVEHEVRVAEWVAWRCSWWSGSYKVGNMPLKFAMNAAMLANPNMRRVYHATHEKFGDEVIYPERSRWLLSRHALFRRLAAWRALSERGIDDGALLAVLHEAFELPDGDGFSHVHEMIREAEINCREEEDNLKRRMYRGHFVWNISRYSGLRTKRQ